MADSKASKRKILGVEREQRALDLRKSGATYKYIGEALGISEMGAYKAVMRALGKLNAKIIEDAEPLRRLELERLDRMLAAIWAQVVNGNQGAVDRALRIAERRARLLGLDAPTRQSIEIEEPIAVIVDK